MGSLIVNSFKGRLFQLLKPHCRSGVAVSEETVRVTARELTLEESYRDISPNNILA